MSDAFWLQQCPERGYALSHMRKQGDPVGVCSHCGGTPDSPVAVNVAERLESLGIRGHNAPGPSTLEPVDPPVRAEPKSVTGYGPQGPTDGRGRGTLTKADEERLYGLVFTARPRATLEP